MVVSKCSIILPFLLLGMVEVLTAQWHQIPGTENAAYTVIVDDGSYLYAGTYIGNLRRTNDSGQSWQDANTGLPDSSIFVAMYGDRGLLLLGTGKGAFRSIDQGSYGA